jgi:hypothetical protein
VFWSLGELLAGSPKPDRSNVKEQMGPHVAGGDSKRLTTSPYKTTCINKHIDCCHMENSEKANKRVKGQ